VNGLRTNPQNDRVKRDYLIWLREAKQRSPSTVEQVRHAIDRFEVYNRYKDFGTFNKDQAIAFKQALLSVRRKQSGKPVAIATVHHTLQAVKDFLAWLQGHPGYLRRIKASDIAYLNLSAGEERQAKATGPKGYASLDDYRSALFAMPSGTEIERRDQALMAVMLLTCMRDAAVVTLKLKHVSLDKRRVFQNPRDVKTKFSKTIETYFYPVGADVVEIVRKWLEFVTTDKGFGPDDPLFSKTVVSPDADGNFTVQGLSREHWANATPVRRIFRIAFQRIGLPYFNLHSIRSTLTQLAYALQLTPEEFKAWSQNMGHDKPLTTLNSYGHVSTERQAEIIGGLSHRQPRSAPDDAMADKIAERVAAKLRGSGGG
jgi:integrase